MNRTRRKEIATIAHNISEAESALRSLADEEQEALDNMPENLQGSDRYSAAEEAVDILNEVSDELESLASRLEEIT